MKCTQCSEANNGLCSLIAGRELEKPPGFVRFTAIQKKDRWSPETQKGGGILLVSQGVITISTVSGRGRANAISILQAGELTRIPRKSESFFITALQASTFCLIDDKIVVQALSTNPELACKLNNKYLGEMRRLRSRSCLLGIPSARERLAAFLIIHAGSSEPGSRLPGDLHMPFSRYDIADYLLLSAETVSRSFTELASDGMIETDTPRHIRMKPSHPGWTEVSREFLASI